MADNQDIKKDFWNDVAGIKDETPPASTSSTQEPATTPAATTPAPETTTKELSDTELLELLNKRNIKVTSLEDLKPKPTEAELKAAEEKRKSEAIAYGIQSGKIKKEDYEEAIKATADKEKYLFAEFAAELKKSNPEISDEDIKDEWGSYTLDYLEDDDFKKVQRKKELNELAEFKLKNKFSNFYNLENEYSDYEKTQNQNAAFKQKVEATFPVYKKDVETAIEKLRTQKFLIDDPQNPDNNEEVEFQYSNEDLKELQDVLLSKDEIVSQIKNGYTLESIIEAGDMFLAKQHRAKFVSKAAKDYNSKKQGKYLAGRHGIIPNRELVIAGDADASSVKKTFWKDVLPQEGTPASPK